MGILQEDISEECATGAEDCFMCKYLFMVFTHKGDITKVPVAIQKAEGFLSVKVEISPYQPKLFSRHCFL